MRKRISGIYKIINILNNHFYVGSTSDIHRRWLQHKKDLKNNTHYNDYLQNAWNKYGENNFRFIIEKDMSSFNTKEILNEEQKLLDIHFRKEYCYNISKSANRVDGEYNPFYGKRHSKETINKLKNNFNIKFNKNFLGKHHSEITKLNQSKLMIGKYLGKNNPRFDKNIYKFFNVITKEIFEGNRYDFYTKYNLHKGEVGCLINKTRNCKSVKNWILL